MRIAILAPINRRIPPRPYGPEEQLISDLAEGLTERGHSVVLFAAGNSLTRAELVAVCPRPLVEWEEDPWPDPRWWEDLHVSECMIRAAREEFDLIHNFLHVKALPFATGLRIPVVTTLHGAAREKQIHSLLVRFRDYPFVAMNEAEKLLLPELNYVAVIGFPDPEESRAIPHMVDRYEDLYHALVAGEVVSPVSELKRITPWGGWEVLKVEEGFKVKRIRINHGQRLSYQRHRRRDEHWAVVTGRAVVSLDGREVALEPGQSIDIPRGAAHRIGNSHDQPLVFIEVQRGEYLGEDDLERLEDDYGRN